MKYLIVFLSFLSFLYAKDTCYTVQLLSIPSSKNDFDLLETKSYPKSCQIMEIGKNLTLRCDCYEKMKDVKKSFVGYKKRYKHAAIASSYKYRFEKKQNILERKKNINTDHKIGDDELRLILQVFLYKSDLKNAYKVASVGYKKHPQSYYWNQKLAEICSWTGRSKEAIKHLLFLYNKKFNNKIESKIIDYGLEAYQYKKILPLVINRTRKNPTKKNINLLLFLYSKTGFPEKSLAFLDEEYKKNPQKKIFLTKALQLSLELGEIKLAKKYVDIIEKQKVYSFKDATLVSRYYYLKRDIKKAYKALKKTNSIETVSLNKKNVGFYQLKSDLAWYLQDNLGASKASQSLITLGEGRLSDYERLAFVLKKLNPVKAMNIYKQAYNKYKNTYLFYNYVNLAMELKEYKSLEDYLNILEKKKSPLLNDAKYWLVRAKVYAFYNRYEKQREALLKASALSPKNPQMKLELLWYFMDKNKTEDLKMLLLDISEMDELDASYYFPLASGYYYINDINRASYYMEALISQDHPITKMIEFRFLQAYIYQIRNNEPAFLSTMRLILDNLEIEAKKNPKLMLTDKFLSNYLRAGMYIWSAEKFENKLYDSKKYLTKINYDEISYSWAIRNKAYEKSLQIYHKMNPKKLWVEFSNSIVFQEHTNIENILDLYLGSISMDDAAQSAQKDGQIALAQSITFEGMRHNERNQNVYIKHLELSQKRTDKLDAKVSYYNRDPLLQKYVAINNKTYLQDAYYLYTGIASYMNETLDNNILVSVPKNIQKISLGLQRLYNRGSLRADMSYHNAMKSYTSIALSGEYRLSTDLKCGAKIAHNVDTIESTQLLLGGKKNMLELKLAWSFLNSTTLDLLYEHNEYNSQGNVYLGDGDYGRIALYRQIRNGYPDIAFGTFFDFGAYNETEGSRGVIDELQSDTYKVLPNDFYNIGVNISYGMVNSHAYTRVWRPYAEFSPYYNSETGSTSYGFNLGYGGKVWHQDHLVFGISYTNSVNGIGGSILELFLKYEFLYYHP